MPAGGGTQTFSKASSRASRESEGGQIKCRVNERETGAGLPVMSHGSGVVKMRVGACTQLQGRRGKCVCHE